jgi:hypothetical protein
VCSGPLELSLFPTLDINLYWQAAISSSGGGGSSGGGCSSYSSWLALLPASRCRTAIQGDIWCRVVAVLAMLQWRVRPKLLLLLLLPPPSGRTTQVPVIAAVLIAAAVCRAKKLLLLLLLALRTACRLSSWLHLKRRLGAALADAPAAFVIQAVWLCHHRMLVLHPAWRTPAHGILGRCSCCACSSTKVIGSRMPVLHAVLGGEHPPETVFDASKAPVKVMQQRSSIAMLLLFLLLLVCRLHSRHVL